MGDVHPESEAAALAEVDRCFDAGVPLRMLFDDSDDALYPRMETAVKQHVRRHGYHRTWEYWYDGCNYAGVDMIKGRPIEDGNGRRGGSCWMSDVWRFEDPPPRPPPRPPSPAAECVVCLDAKPDTIALPCQHIVCCRACSRTLATTPSAHICVVCNTPIERVLADGE